MRRYYLLYIEGLPDIKIFRRNEASDDVPLRSYGLKRVVKYARQSDRCNVFKVKAIISPNLGAI
jgi:hypothetical protein